MQKLSLTKKYQTYPKYKDSGVEWVGDVPETWDVATSRRLFQTKKKLASETESQKVLSLTLNGVIPRVMDGSGKNPANYDTYQEFLKDDLVFCLFDYDVTPRTIGYVEENGMMTSAYTRLIPKSETDSKFFYYYFLYLDYTKELLHLCTGLRNSISKPLFWSLKNPLPPKEEQEKIARFLDEQTARIDETIAKKELLIELLKEKRTATINHVATKGLDPKAELVDSGIAWIGKIPKSWRVEKLKYLAPLGTKKTSIDVATSTYIALENAEGKTGRYLPSAEAVNPDSVVSVFSEHDVLFSKLRPYLAKVLAPGFSGYATGEFLVLQPNKKIMQGYLKYRLLSQDFITIVNDSTYGAQMPRASWNFIGSQFITVPTLEEQKLITNFLDEAVEKYRSVIDDVQKSITLLQELKMSLISHTVTGKIKV